MIVMANSPYIFGTVPKLSAKYAAVVIPFILSFLMSGLISLINIIHNIGFVDHFATVWGFCMVLFVVCGFSCSLDFITDCASYHRTFS